MVTPRPDNTPCAGAIVHSPDLEHGNNTANGEDDDPPPFTLRRRRRARSVALAATPTSVHSRAPAHANQLRDNAHTLKSPQRAEAVDAGPNQQCHTLLVPAADTQQVTTSSNPRDSNASLHLPQTQIHVTVAASQPAQAGDVFSQQQPTCVMLATTPAPGTAPTINARSSNAGAHSNPGSQQQPTEPIVLAVARITTVQEVVVRVVPDGSQHLAFGVPRTTIRWAASGVHPGIRPTTVNSPHTREFDPCLSCFFFFFLLLA